MNKIVILIIGLIILQGCSQYGLNDAIKDNAVIEGPGGPKNVEILDRFVERNAANKKK